MAEFEGIFQLPDIMRYRGHMTFVQCLDGFFATVSL